MENEYMKMRVHGDRANMGITRGECELSEKLDGANFSLKVENDEVMYRSRKNTLGGGLATGKQWRRAVEYLDKVHAEYPFPEGYIPFMECMTPHKIVYGDTPPVVGYGVLNVKYGIYIKNWKEFFESRGIPIVETITIIDPTHDQIMEHVTGLSHVGDADAS